MMGYGSKAKHIYMWVINYESNSNNSTMKAVVKPIYDSVDFIQISYLDYYTITGTNNIAVSYLNFSNEVNLLIFSYDSVNPLSKELFNIKKFKLNADKSIKIQQINKDYIVYFDYSTVVIKYFDNNNYTIVFDSKLDEMSLNFKTSKFYVFPSIISNGVNVFVLDSDTNKIVVNNSCMFFSFANGIFCKTLCSPVTEKVIDRTCAINCPNDKPYIDSLKDECVSKCPTNAPLLSFGYCLPSCDTGLENKVIKSCYCNINTINDPKDVIDNEICTNNCNIELPNNNNNSNTSNSLCRKCDLNKFFIQENNCVEECSPGWIYNSMKVCEKCSTNLTQNNVCVESCQNSFSYIQHNKCVTNCSNNFSISKENKQDCICLKKIQNNICVDLCSTGYGLSENNNTSNNTNTSNQNNINNVNECIMCEFDEFTENEKCVESCSQGSIFDQNKVCHKCNSNQYIYNNSCVDNCPISFIPNPNNECIKCNYYLQNNTCVTNCKNGWIYDSNKICNKCNTNEYVQLNKCVTQCSEDEGYFPDNINNKCIFCGKGHTINSKGKCESRCSLGSVLNTNGICEKIDIFNTAKVNLDANLHVYKKTYIDDKTIIILSSVFGGLFVISIIIVSILVYFYYRRFCCFKPKSTIRTVKKHSNKDKLKDKEKDELNSKYLDTSPRKRMISPKGIRSNSINSIYGVDDKSDKGCINIEIKSCNDSNANNYNINVNDTNLEDTNQNINTQDLKVYNMADNNESNIKEKDVNESNITNIGITVHNMKTDQDYVKENEKDIEDESGKYKENEIELKNISNVLQTEEVKEGINENTDEIVSKDNEIKIENVKETNNIKDIDNDKDYVEEIDDCDYKENKENKDIEKSSHLEIKENNSSYDSSNHNKDHKDNSNEIPNKEEDINFIKNNIFEDDNQNTNEKNTEYIIDDNINKDNNKDNDNYENEPKILDPKEKESSEVFIIKRSVN